MYYQQLNRICRNFQILPYSFRWMSTGSKYFPVLPDTLNVTDLNLTPANEKSQKLLAHLKKINDICYGGGGEKGRQLHVNRNKKVLPRDRLKYLFDDGSETIELSLQAGLGMNYGDIPGASAVCAIGQIHGHYCLVTANDGTLKGGTFFPITVKKSVRAQEISSNNFLPMLNLVDSGGGFLPLQADLFPDKLHGGRGFYNQAVDGAKGIPQMSLVCGSCTAGGAYVPMMCEDAGIVHKIGSIFLGGPPLVKAATGEQISVEELGGATLHCNISGCTDYFATTEVEGLEMLRDAFASINFKTASSKGEVSQPSYNQNDLDVLCGAEAIDKSKLLGVISRIVDGSKFREFKQNYGQNLVTGYAVVDNFLTGIVGNAGPLTYEDGLKGSHFIQICQHRNLPLIFLQNSGPLEAHPSLSADTNVSCEERYLTLRGRASMMASLSCAKVPKITINIGSCIGDDNYTMCGPSFNPNFIFCWPGADTVLDPVSLRRETEKESDSNKQKPSRSASSFNFPQQSCWYFASRTLNDGIIFPSETRKVIIHCLRIFEQKERLVFKGSHFPVFRF